MTKNDLIEKYMKEIKELKNKQDADRYNGDYHPAYSDRIKMMNEFIKDLKEMAE